MMARDTPKVRLIERGSEANYFVQSFLKDFNATCNKMVGPTSKMELTKMNMPAFVTTTSKSKYRRGVVCIAEIMTEAEKKVFCLLYTSDAADE